MSSYWGPRVLGWVFLGLAVTVWYHLYRKRVQGMTLEQFLEVRRKSFEKMLRPGQNVATDLFVGFVLIGVPLMLYEFITLVAGRLIFH